jgi:hypothetical protein
MKASTAVPAFAGIILGRAEGFPTGIIFGGQYGSAAAIGPSATSGILVLIEEFIVSMNVFAITA